MKLTALWLATRTCPLRVIYPAAGLVFGISLAAGLLVARATLGDGILTSAFAFVALAALFVAVGRVLGRREDALWETSRIDPLTSIGNRRSFEERMQRELYRALESGMPLALLAIDLDHLKELNDFRGHDAGDRALRRLGDVLRSTCRSRDLPARFGGDEFMVVMPRSTADEAAVLGERIRAAFCADFGASVSIGAADLTDTASSDPRALLEAADRALYTAKNGGRNRVALAGRSSAEAPVALPACCTWDFGDALRACEGLDPSTQLCPMDVNLRLPVTRMDDCAPPETSASPRGHLSERFLMAAVTSTHLMPRWPI